MKNLIVFLTFPLLAFANEVTLSSKIEAVTVYLSGAQVTRTAQCSLAKGINEIVFTGLSHKIDESSIQISGLGNSTSILSIAYDIDHIKKSIGSKEIQTLEKEYHRLHQEITLLKNRIFGLEEEEKVITTNRLVSTDNQSLDLDKIKQISQYYRERITAIRNDIFTTQLQINDLKLLQADVEAQLKEINAAPDEPQGIITVKFDTPLATTLDVSFNYLVEDAGWVPNYDIKSSGMDAPLDLSYKAHVYQRTGQDWNDVQVILSTGTPEYNIKKPKLKAHYLNFINKYTKRYDKVIKKKGYSYNPSVTKVVGTVTDASGLPLPGVSVVISGTSSGTQTDFDGNYELAVPYGQELKFSYIGMHETVLPIYASIVNVAMEEDASVLEEVVVTGYGSDRSKNTTGVVSSVTMEQIVQGKTAGIQIRGMSSVGSRGNIVEASPLYIVDGVPVAGFVEGDLDEREIQNVEILNGVNATELYGSRAIAGVVLITTKKSNLKEDALQTQFVIKKPYNVAADGDITAITINRYSLPARYEYFAAPVINENVFLTASFSDWEQHQFLPGEANIYFDGGYSGKTVLDPYTTKKEMVLSLGIEPNITVNREQQRNYKRKSFTGSNRILNRVYDLKVKNNKNQAVSVKMLDRIPISQNKEIRIDDMNIDDAVHDKKNGLLTWQLNLKPKERIEKSFSFQVKYPKGKNVSL